MGDGEYIKKCKRGGYVKRGDVHSSYGTAKHGIRTAKHGEQPRSQHIGSAANGDNTGQRLHGTERARGRTGKGVGYIDTARHEYRKQLHGTGTESFRAGEQQTGGLKMAGYSDLRRTIAGALSAGDKDKAKKYAADSWGSLDANQKSELTRLGVAPSLPSPSNGIKKQMNDYAKGFIGGAGNLASSIVNGGLAGILGGKTPQQVADEIKGSGGTYTPTMPTLPDFSNEYKQEQVVEMPVSVGDLPTYNSAYMDKLNALARQLTEMNYDDWTKGSQYQSLADRYGDNGRLSMQDVLGQIASRTGGMASSYATTAAQQQYNQYMAQLEEVARQMYSQERGDILENANLYRNLANDEYSRYRDSLADYNERLAAAQAAARSAYSGGGGGTGNSGGSGRNFSFVAEKGPGIERAGNRVSAKANGVSSFSDIKRTISGHLASGNVEGASRLVDSVWDDLSKKQKQDIKKMGFSVK
nr:MAG TPA: hypothetical protein [Caudoviricetes sp.]